MGIVNSKCYYCGEPVQVDSEKDAWICPGCGEPFIVEKSIRLSGKSKAQGPKRVVVSPVRAVKVKAAEQPEAKPETPKPEVKPEAPKPDDNPEAPKPVAKPEAPASGYSEQT